MEMLVVFGREHEVAEEAPHEGGALAPERLVVGERLELSLQLEERLLLGVSRHAPRRVRAGMFSAAGTRRGLNACSSKHETTAVPR